jgi:hypothetical protein
MLNPTEMIHTKQKYIRYHCELGDHPITPAQAYHYRDPDHGVTEYIYVCPEHLAEWIEKHYNNPRVVAHLREQAKK